MSDIVHSLEKVELHNQLTQARQQIEHWKARAEAGESELYCDECEQPLQRESCYHVRNCTACRKRELSEAEQQLAASQAVLLQLVNKLEAVHKDPQYEAIWGLAFARSGHQYTGLTYTEELAKAKEQPTDALRAFVLGLLPDFNTSTSTYGVVQDRIRVHNAVLAEIRANLEKALEVK